MADGGFHAVPIKSQESYNKLNRWGVFNANHHENFLSLGVDILVTYQGDDRNLGDEEGNLVTLRMMVQHGISHGKPYRNLHPKEAYEKMDVTGRGVKSALSGLPDDIKLSQFLYELNEACKWDEEAYHELWT